jgi:HNH endonuclease
VSHSAARVIVASSACCERAPVPYRADRGPAANRAPRSVPNRAPRSAPRRPASSPAARPAPATSLPRTETAARRADALARSLCTSRDRLTEPLARIAAALVDERAWCSMGFARAADFAREHLGRSARWLRDLATLHRGLSTLPGLAAALTGEDAGAPIGRRRALLVARVADASTLAAWLARARSLTVRELQAEVARALQAGASISSSSASDPALTPTPAATSLAADVETAGARTVVSSPVDLDDEEDRSLVRVAAPRAVVAAFDEAIDLYRAVEGADATVSSFIEALVAEASAGGAPVAAIGDGPGETLCDPISGKHFAGSAPSAGSAPPTGHAPPAAIVETALARSTDRWRHLPRSADASWGLALGHSTLARLAAVVRAGAGGTAAERVARMKELLAIENEIEIHLGRLLTSMGEQDAWNRLRFASMAHYAEERLGLSRTAAQTRARAARALRCFPLVRDAYEHDAIGLEAALLVGRVLSASGRDAGARAEAAWVNHASEVTFKRLRDEERALSRFAAFFPACAPTPEATPLAPGTAPPGDADWHASLRREPGTARRRVAALGLVALGARPGPANQARAESEFDPATALVPEPDVFLRLTLPDDLARRFLAAIETARHDLTVRAESIPWDAEWPPSDGLEAARQSTAVPEPAPTPALLAARMFSTRSRRVPAWVGLLAMIEDFVATWDPDEHVAPGANHRKGGESRGPSSEDAILVRDGWRCAAPACSSRRNLEVHHVIYRSRGGGDEEWNLVTLCRFHHQRGEHGGLARCEGRAPLGLTWRLGAAQAATWYRNERHIATPLQPGIMTIRERSDQAAPGSLPNERNPDQRDGDQDGIGDACDGAP